MRRKRRNHAPGFKAKVALAALSVEGKRTGADAQEFLKDLSSRLANRVQMSTDALPAYVDAVEQAFGAEVDYGRVVKIYRTEPVGEGRYSPPKVVSARRSVISGNPVRNNISNSLLERQNLTIRMSMRRFTRHTNAYSKKVENLRAAVAIYFAHYNFVRIHKTLRVTPAMASGVSGRLWSIGDLVEMAEAAQEESN